MAILGRVGVMTRMGLAGAGGWRMVGTVVILDLGTGYMDKSCR